MRSSLLDDFLLFCSQLKKKSAVVTFGGTTGGKIVCVEVTGRITGITREGLIVKGRGCELWLELEGAEIKHWRPKDASLVTLRPADPKWATRSSWEIRFRRGGTFLVGELAPPPDR